MFPKFRRRSSTHSNCMITPEVLMKNDCSIWIKPPLQAYHAFLAAELCVTDDPRERRTGTCPIRYCLQTLDEAHSHFIARKIAKSVYARKCNRPSYQLVFIGIVSWDRRRHAYNYHKHEYIAFYHTVCHIISYSMMMRTYSECIRPTIH